MYENTVMEKGFPLNVFQDVTGVNPDVVNIPSDITGTVMYLVYSLPEQYIDIFLKRYKDGMAYRKIGELYGVSGSRVEFIISECIVRLKKDSGLLTNGVRKHMHLQAQVYEKSVRESIEKASMEKYLMQGYAKGLQAAANCDHDDITAEVYNDTSIADFDFSPRSYNTLRENGIYTVGDILRTGNKLEKLKNLGAKSCTEIITSLSDIGIPVRKYFNRIILHYAINC